MSTVVGVPYDWQLIFVRLYGSSYLEPPIYTGHMPNWPILGLTCPVSHTFFYFFFLSTDGKYHVVPSGDLHVLRSDTNDAGVSYSCMVRNTLTGMEEVSPPFHLAIDSKSI
jgi:hypothetical protein